MTEIVLAALFVANISLVPESYAIPLMLVGVSVTVAITLFVLSEMIEMPLTWSDTNISPLPESYAKVLS